MIKSMTGFGKHTITLEDFTISVEIKAINSKYFDISFKIPKILSTIEITERRKLQEELLRGKIDVRIDINSNIVTKHPVLHTELIYEYKKIFSTIAEEAGIEDKPKLDHFLRMPDVLYYDNDESKDEEIIHTTIDALKVCIKQLDDMRIAEGKALEKDISERIDNLKNNVALIENAKEDIFEYWKNKFQKRMEEMAVDITYEDRIIQEASIMGEKADITEEVTRLKSHLEQFKRIMLQEFPVGKKLDFLSQEIHRELNTIASKSSAQSIITTVVNSKAEIDRVREQIQNIL